MPKHIIDLSPSALSSLSPTGSREIMDRLERQAQTDRMLVMRVGKDLYKSKVAATSLRERRARAKQFFTKVLRAHGYAAKHPSTRVSVLSTGAGEEVRKTSSKSDRSRLLLLKVRSVYPISVEQVKKVGGT